MATKTTKKKGETATTVSVGIRIDPKIKFALDMMGRQQKRSLTAVIEWAISSAIAQQPSHHKAGSFEETFSELIDRVWSTDESTRFVRVAFYMPESLTYDELRIWETIKASSWFWNMDADRNWKVLPEWINYDFVRMGWQGLIDHVERHKNSPTIVAAKDDDLISF